MSLISNSLLLGAKKIIVTGDWVAGDDENLSFIATVRFPDGIESLIKTSEPTHTDVLECINQLNSPWFSNLKLNQIQNVTKKQSLSLINAINLFAENDQPKY